MRDEVINDEIIQCFIDTLNEALRLNPSVIEALFHNRVKCGDGFDRNPHIQVGLDAKGDRTLGLLGLINGICGNLTDGQYIQAVLAEEKDLIISFEEWKQDIESE